MMPLKSWAQINSDPDIKPLIINDKFCYDTAGIIKVANLKKDLKSLHTQTVALEMLLELEHVDKEVVQSRLSILQKEEKALRKRIKRLQRKSFFKGFNWGFSFGVVGTISLIVLI